MFKTLLILALSLTAIHSWCPPEDYPPRGKGYADRYWDCCKEYCSYEENAGKYEISRSCDKYGYLLDDYKLRSSCEGGEAYCCPSHAPFVDKECKEVAYGFAKVPKMAEPHCGKCYMLRFTGEGVFEQTEGHKRLAGKRMYLKTIGYAEERKENPWDILIPGGGYREVNGCKDLYKDLGSAYGGLLTDCENEIGYGYNEYDLYMMRKECLKKKCEMTFPFGSDEYYGCLFLADWMEAAGYPRFEWSEAECPKELDERYGLKWRQ